MTAWTQNSLTSKCHFAACNNCFACSVWHPAIWTNWFTITCSLKLSIVCVKCEQISLKWWRLVSSLDPKENNTNVDWQIGVSDATWLAVYDLGALLRHQTGNAELVTKQGSLGIKCVNCACVVFEKCCDEFLSFWVWQTLWSVAQGKPHTGYIMTDLVRWTFVVDLSSGKGCKTGLN